jgi:histidinol-phosphate/aromatic aminotransferase/cobyric acid decarboxylase-like protein
MHKVRAPYPIARPAVTAAMAELQALTPDALAKRIAAVTSARQKLMTQLLALPCVKYVYPSESNFILIRTSNAASVMRCCARAGIIVRDRSKELGLAECVRISVGTEAENAVLIATLSAGESP